MVTETSEIRQAFDLSGDPAVEFRSKGCHPSSTFACGDLKQVTKYLMKLDIIVVLPQGISLGSLLVQIMYDEDVHSMEKVCEWHEVSTGQSNLMSSCRFP